MFEFNDGFCLAQVVWSRYYDDDNQPGNLCYLKYAELDGRGGHNVTIHTKFLLQWNKNNLPKTPEGWDLLYLISFSKWTCRQLPESFLNTLEINDLDKSFIIYNSIKLAWVKHPWLFHKNKNIFILVYCTGELKGKIYNDTEKIPWVPEGYRAVWYDNIDYFWYIEQLSPIILNNLGFNDFGTYFSISEDIQVKWIYYPYMLGNEDKNPILVYYTGMSKGQLYQDNLEKPWSPNDYEAKWYDNIITEKHWYLQKKVS